MIYGSRTAQIYPIFKSGDENDTNNYRGISLLDIGYKIISSIMNRRLAQCLTANKIMMEGQTSFRGTKDHVFLLNNLVGNKSKRDKGSLEENLMRQ